MAIPRNRRVQLSTEGLGMLDDLSDFDDKTLKQVVENLRKPGGTIPDPRDEAPAGAVIPTPSFVFGAKSQMRLKGVVSIAKYYDTTDCELTAANMRWTFVIKNFVEA